jgi:hypothetical protein
MQIPISPVPPLSPGHVLYSGPLFMLSPDTNVTPWVPQTSILRSTLSHKHQHGASHTIYQGAHELKLVTGPSTVSQHQHCVPVTSSDVETQTSRPPPLHFVTFYPPSSCPVSMCFVLSWVSTLECFLYCLTSHSVLYPWF